MPAGTYFRSEYHKQQMSIIVSKAMNKLEIIEKQRKGALLRWKNWREKPVEKIEPLKLRVVNPDDEKALQIAKDFVNSEMPDKDYGRLVIKVVESQNGKEEPIIIEVNYDKLDISELKEMAENLEYEFSKKGLLGICREVFVSALREEKRGGERAKYIEMLRGLSAEKGKLEETRKRRG